MSRAATNPRQRAWLITHELGKQPSLTSKPSKQAQCQPIPTTTTAENALLQQLSLNSTPRTSGAWRKHTCPEWSFVRQECQG